MEQKKMWYFYYSIFFIFAHISAENSDLLVKIVIAVFKDNNCNLVNVFLDTINPISATEISKLKLLSAALPVRTVDKRDWSLHSDSSTTLHVLWSPPKKDKTFWESFYNTIAKGITLLFGEQNFEDDFDTVKLRMDSRIVAAVEVNKTFEFYHIYGINTSLFKNEYIGLWENTKDMRVNPEIRSDFGGCPIKLGLSGDFDTQHSVSTTFINRFFEANAKGALNDHFKSLSKQLNFVYSTQALGISSFTFTEKHSSKIKDEINDDEWFQTWYMLIDREVEGVISTYTMTSARVEQSSFLYPIVSSRYQFYMRNGRRRVTWFAVLAPLNKYVWLAIVGWMIVGSISLTIAAKIAERAGITTNWDSKEALLLLHRSFCQQGPDRTPKTWSCRIIIFFAYLATTVLIPCYSASLVSFLTHDHVMRPFETVDELAEGGKWKILVESNSSMETLILKSNLKAFQQLIPKLEFYKKSEEAVKKICEDESYVMINGEMHMHMHLKKYIPKTCSVVNLQQPLQVYHEAQPFIKGSQFVPAFKYQYLRYRQAGLIHRHMKHIWRHPRAPPQSDFHKVRVEDLLQMFIILCICIVLSFFILLIEKYYSL